MKVKVLGNVSNYLLNQKVKRTMMEMVSFFNSSPTNTFKSMLFRIKKVHIESVFLVTFCSSIVTFICYNTFFIGNPIS